MARKGQFKEREEVSYEAWVSHLEEPRAITQAEREAHQATLATAPYRLLRSAPERWRAAWERNRAALRAGARLP